MRFLFRAISLLTPGNIIRALNSLRVNGYAIFVLQLKQALSIGTDEDLQYQVWIRRNEPKHAELKRQRKHRHKISPTLSIILVIDEPDWRLIDNTVASVIAQTYDRWELLLCFGSGTSETSAKAERLLEQDNRLRVEFEVDGRLERFANGDYLAIMRQGDTLSPYALFEVVAAIEKTPDADIVYSDEDMADDKKNRCRPSFKPDWSPDYLLSCNYLGQLTVIGRKLAELSGGVVASEKLSMEYDLVLRASEAAEQIVHIPKVLYHSRLTTVAKDDATAEKNAIAEAIRRRALQAEVLDTGYSGYFRVKYRITSRDRVSIIVPTKDKADVLETCISSILSKSTYENYEVIIVDNGSVEPRTQEYFDSLKDNPRVTVLAYDAPFNYSKINNYAVKNCSGRFLTFLNNDTEVISPGWMEAMIEHAQRQAAGVVGVKLLFPNGTIQHAGVIVGICGMSGHAHRMMPGNIPGYQGRVASIHNLSAVTGACMMIRKELFEEVGGFDEDFVVAFNDLDLCMRIKRLGYQVVYTPFAELYHHECYTRGHDETREKQLRCKREFDHFKSIYAELFSKGDPYYNPNLTLHEENFSIRL